MGVATFLPCQTGQSEQAALERQEGAQLSASGAPGSLWVPGWGEGAGPGCSPGGAAQDSSALALFQLWNLLPAFFPSFVSTLALFPGLFGFLPFTAPSACFLLFLPQPQPLSPLSLDPVPALPVGGLSFCFLLASASAGAGEDGR